MLLIFNSSQDLFKVREVNRQPQNFLKKHLFEAFQVPVLDIEISRFGSRTVPLA